MALSFDEPTTLNDLGKSLGYENVSWLWVNTTTEKQIDQLESNWDDSTWKVKRGEDAYGFSVSEEYPYSVSTKENVTVSGLNLNFIC